MEFSKATVEYSLSFLPLEISFVDIFGGGFAMFHGVLPNRYYMEISEKGGASIMKQWIKFYSEALHDRKMRKLSRFDKSVFYDLLLLACQEDKDGYLPVIDDIALELDLKVTEASKSVDTLEKAGLLSTDDNGALFVTNYTARQEVNLTPAEKQKRYRDRKAAANVARIVTESLHECYPTDTDTLPQCNECVTANKDISLRKVRSF